MIRNRWGDEEVPGARAVYGERMRPDPRAKKNGVQQSRQS